MSMLDSFFNKGFKASKCKTLLKLTIPRIKLLRNKRELQIKQMRKEIARLLETGQEPTARIRVEHIIREENMMAAQEIIELFCELISARLPIIETQRECPLDLKEAISSVCFAAPRCADLPELQQVQVAFASKYGREFLAAATGLMPDCGVNRQLIELFSVRAPPAEKKLNLLKEIAEEHGLDWDPAPSETELFKSHEDLLDGSTQFVTGSKLPLPKEKHEEVLHSTTTEVANEQSDSDSGLDSLDFPSVPKAILRPNAESGSTREDAPFPSAPHPELDREQVTGYENLTHQTSNGPEEEDALHASDHEMPRAPEGKQFVPFIYSPPVSFKETVPTIEPQSSTESETADPSPHSLQRRESLTTDPSLQSLHSKSEMNVDLEDVLVAAQAAAESAERAATAARAAANLAQFRISEISSKKYDQSPDAFSDNPFGMESNLHLDRQMSSADSDDGITVAHGVPEHQMSSADSDDGITVAHGAPEHHENYQFTNASSSLPTYDANESLFRSSSFGEGAHEQLNPQQLPQRMTSMEDDPLSPYPNLFGSGNQSFTETSRSNT